MCLNTHRRIELPSRAAKGQLPDGYILTKVKGQVPGTSTLNFLWCYKSNFWFSPKSRLTVTPLFLPSIIRLHKSRLSLGMSRSASPTPTALWHFSYNGVDFNSLFTKSSGICSHLSWLDTDFWSLHIWKPELWSFSCCYFIFSAVLSLLGQCFSNSLNFIHIPYSYFFHISPVQSLIYNFI